MSNAEITYIESYDSYTENASGDIIPAKETCAICGHHIRYIHVVEINGERKHIGSTCASHIDEIEAAEKMLVKAAARAAKQAAAKKIQRS